ncbi:hypothetical protein HPB49_019243 [Dermacentor silvarum]|uniref:Uncharacterized protein n=1 Tax=Dermacentor silvarum TaxID=543639 RepID=A0ACB8DRD7_DERSI|nr:hypothetical protein HPB49_019243 [Dermacentor silvarum]
MLDKLEVLFTLTCLARCMIVTRARTPLPDPAPGRCDPRPESYSIENRASCTFTRVLDIDPHRIPQEIASVKCKCPGNICNTQGDYRCQDVKERVKVSYPAGGACGSRSSAWLNKTVEVTIACVCALSRTLRASEDLWTRPLFAPRNITYALQSSMQN